MRKNKKMSDNEPSEIAKKAALEAEFISAVESTSPEINRKLEEASKLLSEAVELSEKSGITFYGNLSFITQKYTPRSYYDKFGNLDREFIKAYNFDHLPDEDGYGWQHSDVC